MALKSPVHTSCECECNTNFEVKAMNHSHAHFNWCKLLVANLWRQNLYRIRFCKKYDWAWLSLFFFLLEMQHHLHPSGRLSTRFSETTSCLHALFLLRVLLAWGGGISSLLGLNQLAWGRCRDHCPKGGRTVWNFSVPCKCLKTKLPWQSEWPSHFLQFLIS